MTRETFLKELNEQIQVLPKEEQVNIMKYYVDYFNDAGEELEEEVIKELGSPFLLATTLKQESQEKLIQKEKREEKWPIWLIVLLCIFALPILIPLGFAAIIVVFSLIFALICIIGSFLLAGFIILLIGVILIPISIFVCFQHLPTGILSIGISLVVIGGSSLFLLFTFYFMRFTIKGCHVLIQWIYRKGKKICQK